MKRLFQLLSAIAIAVILISCGGGNNNIANDPIPNLTVTGIEISQGTQNLDNGLPLVTNRWTIVRVYVDDLNNKGAQNITARLKGLKICPGPGCDNNQDLNAPLPILLPWNPNSRINIAADNSNQRINLDDSFWFFLPKSWRGLPGTLKITAEVNYDDTVTEVTLNDNELSTVVEFHNTEFLKVRTVPLHLHQGWDKDKPAVLYQCDRPDYMKIMRNLYRYHPVSQLWLSCANQPLEPFPHEQMSNEIAPFEWDMGSTEPDGCSDAFTRLKWLKNQENFSGTWHYVGMIDPSLGSLCNGWAGAASGDAVWLKMNGATNSTDKWRIDGGITLAHEIGHSRLPSPDHIYCKGNEGPPNGQADTNYPYIYPNCRFSAANPRGFYGLDVYYALWPTDVSGPTVLPNGDPNSLQSEPKLFPLMGYMRPKWTEPYTYCEMLNSYVLTEGFFCDRDKIDQNIGGQIGSVMAATKPASNTVPLPQLTATELVMVSGLVNFADGQGRLRQIARHSADEIFQHVIDSTEKQLAHQATTHTVNSRFALEVLDSNGTLLYSQAIIDEGNQHEQSTQWQAFVELLNFPTGATTVRLVDHESSATDNTIVSRSASAYAPTVSITPITRGTVLDAGSNISWQGADQDNDDVHYSIRYSPDNGDSWHIIALDIAATSYTLSSTEHLPGSTTGQLQIIANDGFNTASAITNAALTVSDKPPQISLHNPPTEWRYDNASPLVLSATVIDAEDGLISEGITWHSDIDGIIGNGQDIIIGDNISNANRPLSRGRHQISVTAIDSSLQTRQSETFELTIFD